MLTIKTHVECDVVTLVVLPHVITSLRDYCTMNGSGPAHSLSWKERTLAQEHQQAIENTDVSISNGEMSVKWASSQGGCGPLKRLLRDVESKPNLTSFFLALLTHSITILSSKTLERLHG